MAFQSARTEKTLTKSMADRTRSIKSSMGLWLPLKLPSRSFMQLRATSATRKLAANTKGVASESRTEGPIGGVQASPVGIES